MDTRDRRHSARPLAVFAVAAVTACSGGPTGPSKSAPAPTPVSEAACTAGAPQPMTSFTADPSVITDGDTLTLKWAAPCGFVSIARKGMPQFALNQPSTGSYVLRPDLDGYPAATGATVYEATNGDAAPRLETTVTVLPRPTPTPTPAPTPTPVPTPTPLPPCTGTWTRWYDIDDTSGKGDYETKSAVDGAYPGQVCATPITVRCQTLAGVDWQQTGDVVHATATGGCWCVNAEQPSGSCKYDYEVAFCCP
jgi:hypothetical protein